MSLNIRERDKGSSPIVVLIAVAILLISLVVGKSIAQAPQFSLILIVALAVGLVAIVNTDIALIILIFSMLFSPEFKLAEVTDRAVVVRIDDILLIVVFFAWFAKMAINKQFGLLRHTPLNRLIIAYITVSTIATAFGIANGDVKTPKASVFYLVKYIEYFMLFYMVTNNVRSKKQIKIFIAVLLVTCALVSAYAFTQIGNEPRTTAPFEGEGGEPNTFGGYLLLLFSVSLGIFLYTANPKWRLCCGTLSCFIIPSFLFTLSRGSYLGFIAMYLTSIILTERKRTLLTIILLLGIPLIPVALPNRVIDRIVTTFQPGKIYEPLGRHVALDEAASARVETMQRVFEKWKSRPLLGYGVTGVSFVDSQVSRVLGETGLVGTWVFTWLMIAIFRIGLYSLKTVEDDWAQGLSLGFLAGFVGLLIHAFSASTFIIVRIMEPFWFLAAIVVMLPEIFASPQEQIQPGKS